MKKWITALLAVLVISFIITYIIIPGEVQINKSLAVKTPATTILRFLGDTSKWKKWWPAEAKTTSTFFYKDHQYRLSNIMYNALDVVITHNHFSINNRIILFPYGRDSANLLWESKIKTGYNPIFRVRAYFSSKEIEDNISMLLQHFISFINDSKNIYGYNITLTTLKDTTLISAKFTSKLYPSTASIYSVISNLKKYFALSGARETNYPMLNIRKTDSNYVTMVAIPVDRALKGNKLFLPKRMIIIKDNTLLIEVHGGVSSIQKAFFELGNYMQDHHYGAPALPFESLVTDRSKEADTTKWITRIYAPIM